MDNNAGTLLYQKTGFIKMRMEGLRCKVRVEQHYSETFGMNHNLKQEDVLSPKHFNIALEYKIRNVKIEALAAIFHQRRAKTNFSI